IRLANGFESCKGRCGTVEVFHDGAWGTVCDDSFGVEEATVVCKALGFEYGTYQNEAYFGEGSGEILMDSIDCDGSEESLTECSHNGWGQHDCSHSEDAGVEC
ncbi:hypothetical protein CAPTEDRAFT_38641, partial [Capitella teleta]